MNTMRKWSGRLRHPRAWSLLGLLWLLLWRVFDILLGGNFHAVDPGHCYRGGHPSANALIHIIREYRVRTIINMRGAQTDKAWYHEQKDTAARFGVKLVHIGMWSDCPPEVSEFRTLVRTLADDPGPIYIHCHSGSDRTGLAAALYLLLRTNTPLDDARRQLSLYYGHVPHGKAHCLDKLLDSYETWLTTMARPHSAEQVRSWALEAYDGTIDSHRYNEPLDCHEGYCQLVPRCRLP